MATDIADYRSAIFPGATALEGARACRTVEGSCCLSVQTRRVLA